MIGMSEKAMMKLRIGKKTLRIKDCKGLASVRGLMFDSFSDKDGALIYANNIWMPFCQPLDLYFLDENFAVLEKMDAVPLTLNPKTWNIYKNPKASFCLELKKGMKINIKIKERINLG